MARERDTLDPNVRQRLVDFGRAFYRKRLERNLGLRAVSAALGCSMSTLSRLERGFNVRADTLLLAASWAGLETPSLDELDKGEQA